MKAHVTAIHAGQTAIHVLTQVNGEKTRVVPLLIDLSRPTDLTESTLSQFHAVVANREGFKKLAHSLNNIMGDHKRTSENLDNALGTYWAQLKERIEAVPRDERAQKKHRSTQDMVAETLAIVRAMQRNDETGTSRVLQRMVHEGRFSPEEEANLFSEFQPVVTSQDLQAIKKMVISDLRPYVSPESVRFSISKDKRKIWVRAKGYEVPLEVALDIEEKVRRHFPWLKTMSINANREI